jgi:hypothetical protein
MDFAECLFYSEDRHQTRSIRSNIRSNQWVLKQNAGAACEVCRIIWQGIYFESKKPGFTDGNGVWFPPPRAEVELWADDYSVIREAGTEGDKGNWFPPPGGDVELCWLDDYYAKIGEAGTEHDEGNRFPPPREDVKPQAAASSSSSHQTPSQGQSSSAHQPALASSRISASRHQAQPAGSAHPERSMLDPPVAPSASQAAGSMASGSQAMAPAPAPPIQVDRSWCDQCRDASIHGWRECNPRNNAPCARCFTFNIRCSNDGDLRQGIRPVCTKCRRAGKECDKVYPICGFCAKDGVQCHYDPNINGRPKRT